MELLTKEQILEASDLKTETVEVKAWGGSVTVSEMSGAMRMEWEKVAFKEDGKPSPEGWKVNLVAACLVDDNGDRMFSNEEIAILGKKSDAALSVVYEKAADLNGLGIKGKEDAEKN